METVLDRPMNDAADHPALAEVDSECSEKYLTFSQAIGVRESSTMQATNSTK